MANIMQSDEYTNSAGNGAPTFPFGMILGSSQTLQVDSITNALGNGPPSFPDSLINLGSVATNDSNVNFTSASNRFQFCTPTAARTYTLPTTLISAGDPWIFMNNSAFLITVNASGGQTIGYVYPFSKSTFYSLVSTPTTAANWAKEYGGSLGIQSYTPVFTGIGTYSNAAANWMIANGKLKVYGSVTNGTVAASLFSVSLPSGLSLAILSLNNTTSNPGNIVGSIGTGGGAEGANSWLITAPATSQTLIYGGQYFGNVSASGAITPQNGNILSASSDPMSFEFEVALV